MKRWTPWCLSAALLAQAAPAAEMKLAISAPEPEWVMPALICRNSTIGVPVCLEADAPVRNALDFTPVKQQQPEGIPDPGEEQILLDIQPFIAAGDYATTLDLIRVRYPELALLEGGDQDAFRRARMVTRGAATSAPPGAPAAPGPERPQNRLADQSQATARDIRPPSPRLGTSPAANRDPPPGPLVISASLLYVIGHSYFALGQYVPAEAAFNLGLNALPSHIRLHESLGMLYLATERYADARASLSRALELGRNTAHVHSAIGYLDQRTHHYMGAALAFQRALALAPDDRGVQRGLLHALTETHEHAKAKALVQQLLRDEPDDPALWLYRAQIALLADEPAVAVASLETALRLGDDSVENRRACAVLHMDGGNLARATELLRGPAARGLDFALADRALGWLADANEWDRFRELLASIDRSALDAAQQSRLLTRRASLALRDGNRRAASTGLQEALALDPANAEALVALGKLYHGDRDYGRADLFLQRASWYAPVREEALIARAAVAIDEERFDGALTSLQDVLNSNPARADVRRNMDVLEDLLLLRTER